MCRATAVLALIVALLLGSQSPVQAVSTWAELTGPAFRHIDTSGLPHPAVYALAQDDRGFIWIGTPAGLTRYDGYAFKNFVQSTTVGAPPEVEALLAGDHSDLWIGTRSSGLIRFDEATQTFRNWRADANGHAGPHSASVIALAHAPGGALFVGGDGGLDRFDPISNTFTRIVLAPRNSQPRVEAILVDRSQATWVATLRGLFKRSRNARSFQLVDARAALSLSEDSRGNVWSGSLNELTERSEHGTVLHRYISSNDPHTLAPGEQWAIIETSPGVIWSGTYERGISVVDVRTNRVSRIVSDRANPASLAPGQVWQFMRDRSGLIWIANGPGGLQVFNPHTRGIFELSETTPALIFGNLSARAVAAAPDGTLWLGGSDNVLAIDPRTTTRTSYVIPRHLSVQTLHVDADGTLWIGTLQGLCALAPRASSVACAPAFANLGRVLSITDVNHVLWLGTSSGVIAFDKRTGAMTPYRRGRTPSTLSNDFVLAIFADRNGFIWAGTSAGLNRIDPQTHRVVRFVNNPLDPHSLGAGAIFGLTQDHLGRIWAGAVGGSLNVLTQTQPGEYHIRHVITADGLPAEDAAGLAIDHRGFVWANIVNALARIDPHTFKARTFSSADGVIEREYWTNAVSQSKSGTMFFAGTNGVTIVDPDADSAWNYAPPLVLTNLKIGPNGRDVSVEFAALDYSAPNALRYQYKLDGYDRTWIDTDPTHRSAVYTNLPPGSYLLRVRGTNRLGVWSSNQIALQITSLPLWYETWWFRTLIALAILIAIYMGYQWRTAVLRGRQRELEALVTNRTRDLAEANAKLEQASLTDPLTGLRNRRFLEQHIEADLAAALRRGDDLLFFMVDIDHFKAVNDQLGHRAGDVVLMQMRERLEEVFRESDIVVRWGGEEFLAIARGSKRAEAAEIAERLRRAVADHAFALDGGEKLTKTASIGFATFPFVLSAPRAITWQQVVALADRALYLAKEGGRDRWFGLLATAQTDPAQLAHQLTTSAERVVQECALEVSTLASRRR